MERMAIGHSVFGIRGSGFRNYLLPPTSYLLPSGRSLCLCAFAVINPSGPLRVLCVFVVQCPMNILVCYDVNTMDSAGRKRLRRVAKACGAYGQRVQLSVFECTVSETNMERLRQRLLGEMDMKEDSLRFYFLASDRTTAVEAHGRDTYIDFTAPLVV